MEKMKPPLKLRLLVAIGRILPIRFTTFIVARFVFPWTLKMALKELERERGKEWLKEQLDRLPTIVKFVDKEGMVVEELHFPTGTTHEEREKAIRIWWRRKRDER